MNIIKKTAIALAISSMTIGAADASTYCNLIGRIAHATADAKDAGATREELITLIEFRAGEEAPAVEDIVIVNAAFSKSFSGMTPDGFSYRITRACEVNNWEGKTKN